MSTIDEFEIKFSKTSGSSEELEALLEEAVYYYLNVEEDIIEKMKLLAFITKVCSALRDSFNPCIDSNTDFDDDWDIK